MVALVALLLVVEAQLVEQALLILILRLAVAAAVLTRSHQATLVVQAVAEELTVLETLLALETLVDTHHQKAMLAAMGPRRVLQAVAVAVQELLAMLAQQELAETVRAVIHLGELLQELVRT